MTKVIEGEFEKIKDVKVEDVSLTCDTSLEVFNNEVNQLSKMDDDLFTYEVKVANIPCDSKMDDDSEHEADDDMGYDPSDAAFTEWLGSKGDDEVELTDEESSDDMDEVAKVFRIDTNLFNFETPMCKAFKEFNYLLQIDPDLLTKDIEGFKTYEDYKDDWIYEWNKDVPWVDEKPWTNAGVWTKPTPVKHTCKPFNYKTGCSEWPTCSWKDDGYCNGGNLPGTYIIGNQLHYQDYEWYEALEDSELKDEALRNKAIMEGFIKEDDDESRYEQKRRWNIYTNYDDAYEINHEDNEREELCEVHELPMCNIKRYMMIKYSFNNDEKYVAVKEDKYDDLVKEIPTNISGEFTNLEILKCWSLETSRCSDLFALLVFSKSKAGADLPPSQYRNILRLMIVNTITPQTQYKEYLCEFWYTARTLDDSKIWVSTPIGGIRGDIDYAKLIWEDIIYKISKKTQEKFVPYLRFISLLLEYMMPEYNNEELTKNPIQVFSVHNWALKPNQTEGPPFTDHMKAIYNLDVSVDSKDPKPSSQTEEVPQGKKSRAKSGLRRKQSSKHTSESKTEASKSKTGQS
ncbi:hypothetical protein Tco_0490484 [Tanacetum coccineum]